VLQYQANGRQRVVQLGRYPDLTLTQARDKAGLMKGRIRAEGADPIAERKAKADRTTQNR
jgi:hypothetical protein